VLSGRCTKATAYGSSTTVAEGPGGAWRVVFDAGAVTNAGKDVATFVHAMWGGCISDFITVGGHSCRRMIFAVAGARKSFR